MRAFTHPKLLFLMCKRAILQQQTCYWESWYNSMSLMKQHGLTCAPPTAQLANDSAMAGSINPSSWNTHSKKQGLASASQACGSLASRWCRLEHSTITGPPAAPGSIQRIHLRLDKVVPYPAQRLSSHPRPHQLCAGRSRGRSSFGVPPPERTCACSIIC